MTGQIRACLLILAAHASVTVQLLTTLLNLLTLANIRNCVDLAICMYAGLKRVRARKSSVVKRPKEKPRQRRVLAEVSNLLQPPTGGILVDPVATGTG